VAQSKAPSSRFRLARGHTAPSSRFRLARGHTTPSSRFGLAQGHTPPSSGFRLARGLTPPSSGFRLARGLTSASLEAPLHSRLFPHVGTGILCSDTAEPRHHAPGNHASALFRQLPRGNPSPPLWGTVRYGQCQPRGTVLPTPVRLTRRTLKPFPRESAGSNHDVRPVGTPSLPLWHHVGHCYDNSDAVEHAGMGRHNACQCALYGSPSTASSRLPVNATANHYAFTLEAVSVQVRDMPRRQDWSKGRQDGRQLPGAARHIPTCS
jgi:hypothetical protein